MEELINSWKLLLLSAISGLALLFSTWLKLREGWFRLKRRRTQSLLTLLEKQRWRTASSARLQLAAEEAWGRRVDDRILRFALARHNSITLVDKVLQAGEWITFREDRSGFDEWRLVNWLSLRLTMAIACLVTLASGIAVTVSPVVVAVTTSNPVLAAIVTTSMMLISWFGLKVITSLDAAACVVSLRQFPLENLETADQSIAAIRPLPVADATPSNLVGPVSQSADQTKSVPKRGRKRPAATSDL